MKENLDEIKYRANSLISGRYNRFVFGVVLTLIALWLIVRQLNFLINPIISLFTLVILPFVFSVILYYIFDPFIDRLENYKIPRSIGIAILFFVLFSIFVILGIILVPAISKQISSFVRHLPKEIEEWRVQVQDLLDEPFWHPVRDEINKHVANINTYLNKYGDKLGTVAFHSVTDFVKYIEHILLGAVLIPFMLFFLLKDRGDILPSITKLLPIKWRVPTKEIGLEIHDKLSAYFRAQLVMALGVTVILMIGLELAGVKYALTLAVITGILNFLVPSFGAVIGAIPTIIVALMANNPWQVFWVVVIYYLVQHAESHLVAPLLLGNQLAVHPLTILILLIWAGEIYGFIGLIVIVPFYVILKVFISYLFKLYQEISEWY